MIVNDAYKGWSYEQCSREAERLIRHDGWFHSFAKLVAIQTQMVLSAHAQPSEGAKARVEDLRELAARTIRFQRTLGEALKEIATLAPGDGLRATEIAVAALAKARKGT